jgi:phospholipase/lecithinase/hemolysin
MYTRSPLSKSLIALFIVCFLPAVASAQIPQFDSLFVFGDSFADNGNIFIQSKFQGVDPAPPPSVSPHRTYFNGRFSNGYVEFEYLWQSLTGKSPAGRDAMKPVLAFPTINKGVGAVDFAFGGTGTAYIDQTPGGMWSPGLKGQVELFRAALRGQKPSDRALYAIATGANDYRLDPFNVPMAPTQVVANIEDAIVSLYRLGARDVMVFDLPDLGMIPANGGDPAATALSKIHNDALYAMLGSLQLRLPKLHLITVKLDPLFGQLRDVMEWHAPEIEAFGPVPGMSGCLFIDPNLCQDMPEWVFNNMNLPFLFWDVVHPTTQAHHYLSDYLYQQLAASYH